jgi:hypothetical protein
MNYSNPRMEATINNWPSGRQTVTANFYVEAAKRGQRGVRVTTGQPKKLTCARAVRIVDGDDGRIYFAELAHFSGMISIMRGTMDVQQEVIWENDPRYAEMIGWFEEKWTPLRPTLRYNMQLQL